jgi:uncharacterized protein YodC (DUF2158 family)
MPQSDIKAGDIVQLKSGGPDMTVTQIGQKGYEDHDSAWCSWFEGNKAQNGVYALVALKKSPPPEHPEVVGKGR